MGVKCLLVGHAWGEWEYSRPATQWGVPVRVDVRFCQRCRADQIIVIDSALSTPSRSKEPKE